ncbi:hypothetical protein [Pseudomonas putida]|uniref:Uncharacterized protein n=1 Tax=Pseudomonas putida TaxID=303 RepID=A0A8I1EA70_PSEPU|nr:hypothetical protein [Pseudomonas putida]MBI6882674.1 hypothetical protein [Pseudomonas putida]
MATKRDFKPSHLESHEGNSLKLLAESKDLRFGAARFIRAGDLVIVEIVDSKKNLVIHSNVFDGGTPHSEDETKVLLDQYGSLSWSTASFDEITSHLWRLMRKGLNGDDGRWEARAIMMAKSMLRVLTELRDAGLEELTEASFRSYLPLDRLIALSLDNRASDVSRKQLSDYLRDLPGYDDAEALTGQIKTTCYSQHGFLVSIVITALRQLLPPHLIRYEYQIKAPFKKVEAEITPLGVLVTVQYHASVERFTLDHQ